MAIRRMDEAAASQTTVRPLRPSPWALLRAPGAVFYGWWIVAVASAIQFFHGGLYGTGFSVYFLPVTRDLGVSRAALSLAFTLRSLETGLDGPLVGYLVDRVGPIRMIRVGVILGGLGFVLLGLTQTYLAFLLVFLFMLALGMSAGVGHSLMPLLNQWFARHRAIAITLGYTGAEVGAAVLTPLVGLLVLTMGWRQMAVLSGILIPMVALPLSLLLRPTPESMGLHRDGAPAADGGALGAGRSVSTRHGAPEAGEFGVGEAVRTVAFWHLSLAMAARLFAKTGLQVHLVPLMVWKGVDEPTAALLVGLFAFTQVPLRVFAGWAGDRWSMTKVPGLACLAGAAALGVLLFGPVGSIWTSVAFVLLFAVGEMGNLVSWAIVGHFFGRNRFATLRGAMSMVHSPFSLAPPVLLGWVFDTTSSYTWAIVPMLGSYLVASALYLLLRPPRRAPA